jgi:hypothetical protein
MILKVGKRASDGDSGEEFDSDREHLRRWRVQRLTFDRQPHADN